MARNDLLDVYRLSIREQFFTSIVLNLLYLLREFGTSGLDFDRGCEVYISFFSELERMVQVQFLPSNEDILHIKCGNRGIEEETISRNDSYFRFIRVAMTRSSIHKWVQFFEDVDAIIFISSLLDYSSYMDFSPKKVRLRDDMDYFAAICNGNWFTKCTTVFLILNKFDLFQQKLATLPLKTCFPEYRGTGDATEAAKFIQQRFEALNRCKTKRVFTQVMCVQSDVEAIHQLVDKVIQLTAKPSSPQSKKSG
ncbi:Guanine nucleotide-binding protein G(k) subunit alpha [Echinococcus granulosus]|uniref:Gtp binding protein I alpha 1subunit n=1 Tax=Echinococcus granulosus TaxID=6210 RepID=A0A068X330_ECHGR|nr:Guanine nucleotide-binding protein G(k) subunit alpha [Echinococcus granulosus]CDS24373.1 gtp binding protein I alpha 1subunit [Echinococcus granulosus]